MAQPNKGKLYGAGPLVNENALPLASDSAGSLCMSCFDMREPSFNTIIYGDQRKGFLPAGSYGFTQEGTVVDLIRANGFPLQKGDLLARTKGPDVGATMGACVPRAVQSGLLNFAGTFNPIPSARSRGCYL
jgi:hypothetical protein